MEDSNKNIIKRYFLLTSAAVIFLFVVTGIYYLSIRDSLKQKALIPVITERTDLTTAESDEMAEAYKEIMKRKYGVDAEVQTSASSKPIDQPNSPVR